MLNFSEYLKSRVRSSTWKRAVMLLAGMVAAGGAGAQTYINGSVGGQIAPGVYGRVDIGNGPAPALLYAQPVVISRPAMVVPHAAPVYMYVPPGHAKHWGKHCARYNACGQQVYFLKNPPRKGHRGGSSHWHGEGGHAHDAHRHDRGRDKHRHHGRHDH
jgi:hypothetical protein